MQPPIWTSPIDLAELNRRGKTTLIELLGIEFTDSGADYLTAVMPVCQQLLQPMGIMHGGASCVLAETVGSVAACLCVDQKNKTCVGLDINVNHLRAVKTGILTGTAKPFHLGRTTQVWEIKIVDEKQKMIAISRLTIAVVDIERGPKDRVQNKND